MMCQEERVHEGGGYSEYVMPDSRYRDTVCIQSYNLIIVKWDHLASHLSVGMIRKEN